MRILGDLRFFLAGMTLQEQEPQPVEASSGGMEMPAWKLVKIPYPLAMSPFYCSPSNRLNCIHEEQERGAFCLASVADSGSILLDPAAQAPLTVEISTQPKILAANAASNGMGHS